MTEKITDQDKIKHFIVCLVASILSPEFAIGLAVGKEFGDKYAKGNHWCWLDLLADGIGILIGVFVHYMILKKICDL